MRIVNSVAGMQRLSRRWRAEGIRVGIVPTMGGLHQGHLSLMRRARQAVGVSGRVVTSLFVNPLSSVPAKTSRNTPATWVMTSGSAGKLASIACCPARERHVSANGRR